MSVSQIALLGALAGFTIFLGLPFGRVRNPSQALRVFLNGTAIGVLLFLFWDVLVHAVEPVESALTAAAHRAQRRVGAFYCVRRDPGGRCHCWADEFGVLRPVDGHPRDRAISVIWTGCGHGR